jgi:hypothetical protein
LWPPVFQSGSEVDQSVAYKVVEAKKDNGQALLEVKHLELKAKDKTGTGLAK